MAQTIPEIRQPQEETLALTVDTSVNNSVPVHHATTLDQDGHTESGPTASDYGILRDGDALSSRGSSAPLTPQDAASDRLSPFSAATKPKTALKQSMSPSRLADVQTQNPTAGLTKIASTEIEPSTAAAAGRRKNVQFTGGTQEHGNTSPRSRSPVDEDKLEPGRPFSLYSKLRALAASQAFAHARTTSSSSIKADARGADTHTSPRSQNDSGLSATIEEDTDADADAEESAPEVVFTQPNSRRRRRKMRRFETAETAPSSPHSALNIFSSAQSPGSSNRPRLFRRATDTEMEARQGVSEDEGRKQHENASGSNSPWTPRHPLRGLSYGGQRKASEGNPDLGGRRPLNLLSLSSVTSPRSDTRDPETPGKSRRKQLAERGSTMGAAKWNKLKNSIKLLRKGKATPDQQKSAELLAELAAGTPAALMVASMFQRDEHGSKRIPILLEQLKVNITDSDLLQYKEKGNATPNDRHIVFRMELEYGNGINRMRWVVRRSLNDFYQLHAKYKLHFASERLKGRMIDKPKMPRFPREAFPYLKSFANIKGFDDDEGEEEAVQEPEVTATDNERPSGARHRTTSSFNFMRRMSIGSQADAGIHTPGGTLVPSSATKSNPKHAERQRKALEAYLKRMIQFMLFRPDANRLCKFLEVSALGMRLAAEGSYHGKEGFLVIRSAKGLDFRKALTPGNVRTRHAPKWFLVRHSYIVCVDSPEGMNIYDVFLFDSSFTFQSSKSRQDKKNMKEMAASGKESIKHPQHHRLKVANSERRLKLLARNERQLHQFEESIKIMVDMSPWTKSNRFDSFAPVRTKCFAQWLVDGRDYMWVVSRALNQAKDVIYIHDWWLSPELYMRRPPAISQKWRLDRLLKRKAEQGVKVFVIVYRNIDAAIPIDSQYTKFSLLDLHPNVFVQRSPNQFRQNTFFWAHHEKLCIIDHTLAFVGGIDLCFGRWDTPQHILTDDKPTGFEVSEIPKDSDHCQLWPGKDYSNPRVQDFYALNKPYEEMYDRTVVPRMPWHDISMQVVGQPARDLTRHFVQRWNYILRQRKPTRPTPFLLPPPDFKPSDLEALGLDGTCEVQILRSAGNWSLGTPDKTEHSIMNAYVKMIEESEHFVYMENQFFISSCQTEATTVHNKIGDALVERIIRAAKNQDTWRAVIIIPLMPGFQNTVEQEGGTSVRLIMQYQFRSICRGESSIFGRLRAEGIEPEDYIQFYSLRQWGRIGPNQALCTEQLYIHAKCIIVDDRVALIGSANVNERSMLGNRDSECAAVVRDTDMLWSTMNGKPYRVARFAHTLRMRLMREHLGLDVDKIMEESQAFEREYHKIIGKEPSKQARSVDEDLTPNSELSDEIDPLEARGKEIRKELLDRAEVLHSFNHDVDWEQADNPNLKANRKMTEDPRVTNNPVHRADVHGEGVDHMVEIDEAGFGTGRDTLISKGGHEVLVADVNTEGKNTLKTPRQRNEHARLPSYVVKKETPEPPLPTVRPGMERKTTEQLGLPMVSQLPALPDMDDTDIGGPTVFETTSNRTSKPHHHILLNEIRRPLVDRDCMQDPVLDAFIDDTWHTVAENNTKIFRAVFRCQPDNLVRDWRDYHQYEAYQQRFQLLQGNDTPLEVSVPHQAETPVSRTGPPGVGTSGTSAQIKKITKVPSDLEKAADVIKDKVKDAFAEKTDHEKAVDEKGELRTWAADTNREQMQRQGTDLTTRQASNDIQNPTTGLQTVPEDGTPSLPPSSDGSETQRVSSSQSNNTAERVVSHSHVSYSEAVNINAQPPQVRRRRRATTRSSRRDFSAADDMLSIAEAEELLGKIQGSLVEWPYDWLEKVEAGSNWLYAFDQLSPIEIYI